MPQRHHSLWAAKRPLQRLTLARLQTDSARLFSGSHERIKSIRDGGKFGRYIRVQSQDAADSHGIGSGRVAHYMDIADDKIASVATLTQKEQRQ